MRFLLQLINFWEKFSMTEITEGKMRAMILEILSMERKNLRTKAKSDNKMSEEIAKVIVAYTKERF